AQARPIYPQDTWQETYNNRVPDISSDEILVEFTAHPEARFHLSDGKTVPVAELEKETTSSVLEVVPSSDRTVTVRAVDKGTGRPIPVKLHVHGEFGEYLAPVDRQRIPNVWWFQDYTVDFSHRVFKGIANPSAEVHHCTYIPGETKMKLPQGRVYVEASKGFEFRPVRKVVEITPTTDEVVIELERVLPWRARGWVTADTHVHFLSPASALLEGSGEGVNVVNLLASQWGELMTNVGDFDGRTVFGSREAGGDGEHLVRVGTENRQHVLGHISLLGYSGDIITPLCVGGPGESALGDPVETLLTEWAIRCKEQGGVVILPHYPNPRCENAATIVTGNADGVEMTSWGYLYSGINPYSLHDWYRYLNCGYLVAAVGGTDKMSADTAVGTVRTYAAIGPDRAFTYENWKAAVRNANTFVTYGPLLEFNVEGKPPGSRFKISATGGTVDVTWHIASATIPMSRVELIVNGEIRESRGVRPDEDTGRWAVKLEKSSWLALLVRGHYPDKPEIITAHSSPVMVEVNGSPFMAAADALTILEQIEGALAYIDTVGTRADEATYKRMRLALTSAHRDLHNRMHQLGHYHRHEPGEDEQGNQ
ncbi:MAG TPA: CehA/McbA family metallohydrolase, partial [Thermoleophilia bacterium]|nr:CehA/McbA family metallohydrolase [Thermoleophilia bacterium]